MTAVKSVLPPYHVPLVDTQTGKVNLAWLQYFIADHLRVGGDPVDKVDQAKGTADTAVTDAGVAQSTANTAVTNAAAAQSTADAATTALAGKADKSLTITAGIGLAGTHDLSASFTLNALQDTGWTTSTGTPNKGAYATYGAGTASAGYVQAELQTVMNALQAASQRIKALEDALFTNGGIHA